MKIGGIKKMEKIPYEQVCKLFESKGYKIIGEYERTGKSVLCEQISTGYRCFGKYNDLKAGKTPILWGKFNYSNLNYNLPLFLKNKNSTTKFISWKDISKRHHTDALVTLQCECGTIFNRKLMDLIYKTYPLCTECIKKKRGYTHRKKGNKEFFVEAGYVPLQDCDDCKRNELVEVEDSEGYRGFISCNKILAHKGMSRFDIRINKKNYLFNIEHYAKLQSVNVQCLGFEETAHRSQGLRFKCSCGNEFITSINSFQAGKMRCDECAQSISRLEIKFKSFLQENNINFLFQYTLNQCRDVLPLPFDFYLPDYKIIVEIDGEGHYYPCNFNQCSNEQAQRSFEITTKHDKIKTTFCEENGLKLIRIPYYLFDKNETYKQFFLDSLSSNDT